MHKATTRASPLLIKTLRLYQLKQGSTSRVFSSSRIMSEEKQQPKFSHLPLSTSGPQDCALTGTSLLQSPYFNKGSAFSKEERDDFKLTGLLPVHEGTLDVQAKRAYQQYSSRPDDLSKNTFMNSMKEQNTVLYYRLLQDHLKEMFPIIYTPTEGEAIQNYSRLFRKPAGCFLDISEPDGIEEAMGSWGGADDIDLIVVSDGEQILGLGDQGVGGILISVAKLVIYTLCAGVHPHRTLPVVLDCGTNNKDLLDDELYLGNRFNRVRGKEYDDLIEKFITTAKKNYPKAYIHFEDFGLTNARRILDEYRPKYPIFNDDVQGTGCVTLAALMAALHVSKVDMKDVRIICFGAGSAGTGIADQIKRAIAIESDKSEEEAAKQIWCIDKPGLLLESNKDTLTHAQVPYARSDWPSDKPHKNLLDIVREVHPHVLIGTSTQPNSFTEDIIREMSSHVDRPIVFPLSNPTRLHEAQPNDINTWSEGAALIATGSPFPPVEYKGTKYEVAECNNSTAFPGIGLGAILSRARLMTDKMLVEATKALAAQAPALKDPNAGLLPDVVNVREISVKVAKAVVKQAVEEGLNEEKDIPTQDDELEEWIREQMWDPTYRPLKLVGVEGASKHAKGEAGSQAK